MTSANDLWIGVCGTGGALPQNDASMTGADDLWTGIGGAGGALPQDDTP